jgi:hypothetical protein
MSRGKRKTPIFGHTTAISEKEDKQIWHRAFRRSCRQALQYSLECTLHIKQFFNPCNMGKDGKHYYNEAKDEDMRK